MSRTLIAVMLVAFVRVTVAQVTLDGRFGASGALTGPNYSIPASLGRTVGNNLFQSFGQFNLATGESATFDGPANIQNVIARVTGGSASSIDGTINCTIAGANFFFLNPFGVIFGPHAQINVSGSLVVSTADYVKLADGGRFDARNPANDVLTAAPVSAFGFLGPTPAPIQINGPTIDQPSLAFAAVPEGKTIALIGGDIRIANAQLSAPFGRAAFISVGSAGELAFDTDNLLAPVDTTPFAKLANLDLTDGTTIDVSGTGGGRIVMQGENVTIENQSAIYALTYDVGNGLGVEILARNSINLLMSTVFSASFGAGNSGDVNLTAPSIRLDGQGVGAGVGADTGSSGKAGNITITATSLELVDGGSLGANTSGPGDGGTINITAHAVTIDGKGNGALISATSFTGGKAGKISIQTGSLTLDNDGQINSETDADATGGQIIIQTGALTIHGGLSQISALSQGSGQGGTIDLTANSILLDGKDAGNQFVGITSTGGLAGRGGDILIKAGSLILQNQAQITASGSGNSLATSDAGNINLQVTDLTLASKSMIGSTGANGKAGSVTVQAQHTILIKDQAAVTVSASQNDGGDITLRAGGEIRLVNGLVTAQAHGSGGNVHLVAPAVIYLLNSKVTAEADTGNGGNIFFDPVLAILNHSQVVAKAITGNGGNIMITAGTFLESVSRFDASSQFGIQGSVTITAPDANLTGNLIPLDTKLLSAEAQLNPQCAVRLPGGASSFVALGRGGVPVEPDAFLPAFSLQGDEK